MAFSWTDDAVALLTLLWSQGVTTAQIGARMGVSKNAVVGAAHRAGLPSRESPIRASTALAERVGAMRRDLQDGQPPDVVARRYGIDVATLIRRVGRQQRRDRDPSAATLPPLRSVAAAPPAGEISPAGVSSTGLRGGPATLPVGEISPTRVAAPRVTRRAPEPDPNTARLAGVTFRRLPRPCAWPIGEPGTRTFRSCDDPTEPGRPYCPHHCDVAYVARRRPALEQGGVPHAK